MTQRRVPEKSSQQFSISGNKGLEASLVALDQYKLGGTKRGIYAGTMQYLNTLNRAFNYSTVQTGVTSYKLSDVLKLSQTGSYTASSGVPYNFVVDRVRGFNLTPAASATINVSLIAGGYTAVETAQSSWGTDGTFDFQGLEPFSFTFEYGNYGTYCLPTLASSPEANVTLNFNTPITMYIGFASWSFGALNFNATGSFV